MKIEVNQLDQFSFFNIIFTFEKDEKTKSITENLKEFSSLKFEEVKIGYRVERFLLFEELAPEIGHAPNLRIELNNMELFLSESRISISFPSDLSRQGRIVRTSLKGKTTKVFPSFKLREPEERPKMTIKNLDKVDLFVKNAFIFKLLNNNLPKMKEISIIFGIELKKIPNVDFISNTIRKELFEDKELSFGDFDFEIKEEKNEYFFDINLDDKLVNCSFVYDSSEFSLIGNKLEDIIKNSYDKFIEIINKLKL
jgi:hypothetical protein